MGTHVKAVFLIDTANESEVYGTDTRRAQSICLSCLRLLLFLSSEAEKSGTINKSKVNQTKVKWGYKFFSSRSVRTKIELHKFLDFKLKYFEEFENEILRRYKNAVHAPFSSSVKPSVCLNKALTELLSDFPWEGPDITSPVKGQKKADIFRSKNVIYVFSNCPKTSPQLKKFSGKQVPDPDVFLDSFLPPRLFQELCYTSRLTLNWIDTAIYQGNKNEPSDLLSLKTVESAIVRTGGHVLPLDGIIQNGSPYFVDIQSLVADSTSPEGEEIVQLAKPPTSNHSHSILPLSGTFMENYDDLTSPCSQTVLNIGNLQVCLELVPSTQNSSSSRFDQPMLDTLDLKSCTSKEINSKGDSCLPSTLKAYSLLERSSSSPFQTSQLQFCFIGTGGMMSKKDGQSLKSYSGLFRKLLSSLMTRSCCLVLISEKTGQLLVLEPLTIDTACIYPLSTMSTLSLEKVLAGQHGYQDTDLQQTSTTKHSVEHLVDKLVARKKCRPTSALPDQNERKQVGLDGKLMDRWHIPGNKSSFRSLIQKLNVRINELEFLTKDETAVLKQLQKAYKQEKKPPGVRDTAVSTQQNESFAEPKAEDRFEIPYKGKKSRTSISRAEMILSKSKEVVKDRDNNVKEEKNKDKQEKYKPSVAPQVADFKNVDELKQYLKSTYEKAISGESTCVDVNVQTTVTVALHYLKENGTENPEEECSHVLNDCIVVGAGGLREKYSNQSDLSTEQKMAEYQFQIVLRLEMASTLVNKDQTLGEEEINDEVVGMLRTLSFMCDPGALSKFMETCLLYNYMHTIPKTLANIYDELMQPLPDALSNILSPNNSSADQSVFDASLMSVEGGPPSTRTRSHGSVGPPSSQPGSNKSVNLDTSISRARGGRKLVHHPSLADFGSKRQIFIEKVPTQKEEKRSRKRKRSGKQGNKDIVTKSLFDKSRGTKLERRQSVAVMQSTQKTPKKGPARLLFKSPVNKNTRRQSLVAETPQHKQLSKSLCQLVDVEDESLHMDVVEESPVKAISQDGKDTPTKGKRAKALMRRSFYSAGPIKRTKNLTEYFQLADRIAGRKLQPPTQPQNKLPKLLSLESDKQFKSPEKNSSFLLSQLVYSPSPNKCTPKKLNQTPSKLIMDSPSQNTRSRHPSGVSSLASSLGLFGSPNLKSSSKQKYASSSNCLKQSPVSRKESPRILVPESATKTDLSEKSTPEKSPICGIITTGLDSPSQNTRQKTAPTPTRRSVRAALFSKSPAPNRTFSPRAVNASPRTLLSRFESPKKQITDEILSPRKQLRGFMQDTDAQKPEETNQTSHHIEIKNSTKKADQAGSAQKSCSDKVQKTPSPHAKKVSTPDSFDKWHRRKPRSQVSPAPDQKEPLSVVGSVFSSPSKTRLTSVNDVKSPLRKKRTLILSPECPTESPSKRRRTSRLDSLGSLGRGSVFNSTMIKEGSQGFDVNSPMELSQISAVSSLDYFSAANDDAFISDSQKSADLKTSQNIEDMEIENIENCIKRRVKSTGKGSALMRHRTLEKVASGDFPSSAESVRSESPIFFNSARNTPRHRHVSGDKFIPNNENVRTGNSNSPGDSKVTSPKFVVKSPNANKYSPNVSAKSLMHLMNSPLLHSSEKSEAKSRRSLRLQN